MFDEIPPCPQCGDTTGTHNSFACNFRFIDGKWIPDDEPDPEPDFSTDCFGD